MRTCCVCGALFEPSGKGYRCSPCRREYDRAWRIKRKAEGKPVRGEMPREYFRAHRKVYYARPEARERRNAHMRAYAKAEANRERFLARWKVNRALAKGRLVRQPCEVCGALRVHAHHDDYSKPLDVRWLCRQHHDEHHAQERRRKP